MEWPITKQEWIRLRKEDERLRNVVSQHYRESEKYVDIVREKDLLENLLLSTQQENERCEAELKIWKAYAKDLEKKIESYEGPHWQDNPGVPSTPVPVKVRKTGILKQPIRSARLVPMARGPVLDEEETPVKPGGDFTDTSHFGSTTQAGLGKSHNNCDPTAARMTFLANTAKRRSATFWEYEEQIVPALANAEKKQERRLSLQMLSDASVRRSANEVDVVLDEGDRYVHNTLATENSEEAIETLQVDGYNLSPETALQPATSPAQQLTVPADRLESVITAFESQISAILTRLVDSVDRIHATETVQQDAPHEYQTAHLAEISNLSLKQSTAEQAMSNMKKVIQESDSKWREEADRREERLQTMLEEAKAQAALLIADIPTV